MDRILNITNGDCAVETMKQANIPGEFLPWRDVLHEGPVPEGLSLEALSEVRTRFIADQNWGKAEDIRQSFIDRDNVLKSYTEFDKIILWFEHDLYDQLHILQILDWFSQQAHSKTKLSLICTDQYLGMVTADEMKDLLQFEQPVTKSQLSLARRSWTAFRSPTPEKWSALLITDISALPFLEGTILRLLEEYPDCSNGLSRTAQQALNIISEGEKRPGKVFALYQETEDRRFLGDSSFWAILNELLGSKPPLLTIHQGQVLRLPISPGQALNITVEGKDVLKAKRNWLNIVEPDRWIGGTHLTSSNLWCWDSGSGSLIQRV